MKKVLMTLLVVSTVVASTSAFAKIRVVATLPSFSDIAENVGGDEVSVVALTKGTQDPHFVDAKPALVLQLNKADLLIRAGLGLEDGWLPPLVTGSRNGGIQTGSERNLDASTVTKLMEVPKSVDRSQGDVHPGGNPHYMLDPRNGILLAKGIAERLSKIEPEKAAYFSKRADSYAKGLEKKISEWKGALKLMEGRPVVTYHKSWIYFTAWVGAREAGHVEPKPGIPPSPDHVLKLIKLMKTEKVRLIIMEPFYPKGVAEDVARETNAKLLVLPAEVHGADEVGTYIGLFDFIVKKLGSPGALAFFHE